MSDFVLLYTGGTRPAEQEMASVMGAWDTWYKKLGSSIKHGGNPFAPMAKTVTDGKVRDGAPGSPLTGYTVVTAGSLDEAAELAKGSPILQRGGSVVVYEEIEM
jgi:hypothetical protein